MTQAKNTPSIVREAKHTDALAISELGARVFSATFGHSVLASDLEAYLAESYSQSAILDDLNNPNKDTVIVCPGDNLDHVLGFSILTRGTIEPCISHLSGKTVELQRLYVSEECHGQGLGKLLANQVEELARHQGYTSIWLGVWEGNVKALRVYERLGYHKVGDHDFVTGTCRQRDWVMLKDL